MKKTQQIFKNLYWKGSESHNVLQKCVRIFDSKNKRYSVPDVSPLSFRVMVDTRLDDSRFQTETNLQNNN